MVERRVRKQLFPPTRRIKAGKRKGDGTRQEDNKDGCVEIIRTRK